LKPAEAAVLYLVIERFRHGDPQPVYARFAAQGRLAPDGLEYVASWVTQDLATCCQVMRAPEGELGRALLDAWIALWSDLVDFEVRPVLTSADAAAAVAVRAAPR
jgi:hypothetical protein